MIFSSDVEPEARLELGPCSTFFGLSGLDFFWKGLGSGSPGLEVKKEGYPAKGLSIIIYHKMNSN